jgi:hypothetical protein
MAIRKVEKLRKKKVLCFFSRTSPAFLLLDTGNGGFFYYDSVSTARRAVEAAANARVGVRVSQSIEHVCCCWSESTDLLLLLL